MARLKRGAIPGLRRDKHSGKAVVDLSGPRFYCGVWGSKTAVAEYDRHVAEWLARDRRPLAAASPKADETLVVELLAAYQEHAESYYRKNGKPTSEVGAFKSVARVVDQMYGEEPANTFDSLKLQAVQRHMIRLGWARLNINKQCDRIVRCFAWGVAQRLIRADELAALREVQRLHKGRTEARETAPVLPVHDAIVSATLEHLPPIVADMVRVQRLCGCRPEEICLLRPSSVDRSISPWRYTPESHKTAHMVVINSFSEPGFPGFSGIRLDVGAGNTIAGNFIGTDSTGTIARGNGVGIYVADSDSNMIGGPNPADRNVISGSLDGIRLGGHISSKHVPR